MSRFNNPFLDSKHYALFQHEQHPEPRLTGRDAINQIVFILFWTVIETVLISMIPSRRPPHEPTGLVEAACFTLLISGYCLYKNVWQPWRDGPAGYRLVGEFEVRDKDHLFSKCWVQLIPGENFKVQIEQRLYERLRVGSRLRLIYTAEGEQVSVVLLP